MQAIRKSATREYSLAYCSGRAPATVMGVALSKLYMAIVACICTKEIKGGAPREFAASKIIFSKSGRGSRSERCSGSHHCAFLISQLM